MPGLNCLAAYSGAGESRAGKVFYLPFGALLLIFFIFLLLLALLS